jgi:hypothetical protein
MHGFPPPLECTRRIDKNIPMSTDKDLKNFFYKGNQRCYPADDAFVGVYSS